MAHGKGRGREQPTAGQGCGVAPLTHTGGMPVTPADSALFGSMFSLPGVAALFSDEAYVRRLLLVEGALARVQEQLGILPAGAGTAIEQAAQSFQPDMTALSAGLLTDGVPVAALVEQLRQVVPPRAAPFVHYGATTQDIVDTAFVLTAREALDLLRAELEQVARSLMRLADDHRQTLMAGRTHSQQALPITFGLKAANWLAPLVRHAGRLAELQERLYALSFGGAAGTLAALGERGPAVAAALAAELNLGNPATPWHTARDNLTELGAWLAGLSGSLGKLAQDYLLLAQSEVAELRGAGGGSSTMPQKQNPIVAELVLACASVNAGLLSALARSGVQEHERGTHGWQVEWLTLPQMLALTGAALSHTGRLLTGLQVDATRMQQNVQASQGLMLAEALSFALSEIMPRPEAKKLIQEAVPAAARGEGNLVQLVRERLGERGASIDWAALTEENNLGATQVLIDRVLEEAQRVFG